MEEVRYLMQDSEVKYRNPRVCEFSFDKKTPNHLKGLGLCSTVLQRWIRN